MNLIILNYFRHIRFSILISIVLVFSTCSNPVEPEMENPFDEEILSSNPSTVPIQQLLILQEK